MDFLLKSLLCNVLNAVIYKEPASIGSNICLYFLRCPGVVEGMVLTSVPRMSKAPKCNVFLHIVIVWYVVSKIEVNGYCSAHTIL